MAELNARRLRDVFGLFATGVAVVTAVDAKGGPIGMTVNSLTSVSLDPPMLLWCLAGNSQNLSAFELGARFDIHILAESQAQLAMHFARRGQQKFDVDPHWAKEPAPPHIHGSLARMLCRVHARHEAGDHMIIVGAIDDVESAHEAPLVFHAGKFGGFNPRIAAPNVFPGSSDGWL